MSRRAAVVLATAVVLAAAVLVDGAALLGSRADEGTVVSFVVPPGTASRIAAGEAVTIVPALVMLHVNDTLSIRNDDREAVTVGPFRVEPGQRLVKQYRTEGVYDLTCSLHPDGRLQVVVIGR